MDCLSHDKRRKAKARRDGDMRVALSKEKRKCSRFFLDLPLEFRVLDVPVTFGAIAVDGSESGLLIHSLQDIPVGTRIKVAVLFPNGFELANFEAAAEVVRKDRWKKSENGYQYGLKLVKINEGERIKLKYVLSGLHELVTSGELALDPDPQP
jgi:hypothetical protein